jgi:hypothetical protein
MYQHLVGRVSRDFVVLAADLTVEAALPKLEPHTWVVITAEGGTPIGLTEAAHLRDHDPALTLGAVARALPSLVRVSANASVAQAVHAPAIRRLPSGQPALVVADSTVVGVWAPADIADARLRFGSSRGARDSGLDGRINIAQVQRACAFEDEGRRCLDRHWFVELPDPPPLCRNPRDLPQHLFNLDSS